jgi:pimeloyl-ACP methyl ester carboxylesterase
MQKVIEQQVISAAKEAKLSEELAEKRVLQLQKIFEINKNSSDKESAYNQILLLLQEQGNDEEVLTNLANTYVQMKDTDLYNFEPFTDFNQLTVPILAIYGELDVQVSAKENADLMERIIKSKPNRISKTLVFSELNHLLQKAETGAVGEYYELGETIEEEARKSIVNWINKIF